MLRHDPTYTRLPGGGSTSTGHASYWLGHDHLLLVEVQMASERYRRFDLGDLQSVRVYDSNHQKWLIAIFAIILLLGLIFIIAAFQAAGAFSHTMGQSISAQSLPAFGIGLLVILTGLILMVINHFRGPTCHVELQTAVQTVRLPGLTRWRKTEQFLAALTPVVLPAQAELVPTSEPAIEQVPDASIAAVPEPEPPTPAEPHS